MKQDDRQLIRSKVMQSIDMSGDIGDEQVSDMIDRCILESESGNVLSVRDKLALKKELFNLRFQHATNQLTNPGKIADVKNDIARVKTIIREKQTASAGR